MSLITKARQYVKKQIAPDFHDKRLASLAGLKLDAVLKRKNPYLFRAKAIVSASDLVDELLMAHLSSQEETLFGAFLEGLAIHVCEQAYGGKKSTTEGIDLDFNRDGVRYVVSVKSGPNWGNSSQIAKMAQNFDRARRIAGTRARLVAVNGCCYGKDARPHKAKNYLKLCGQDFWNLISGEPLLYQKIVEPLGHEARQRNDKFQKAFGSLRTRLASEFTKDFCCTPDMSIDWDKIVALNSQAKTLWKP